MSNAGFPVDCPLSSVDCRLAIAFVEKIGRYGNKNRQEVFTCEKNFLFKKSTGILILGILATACVCLLQVTIIIVTAMIL
jgi:hypothetical protein